MSKLTAEQSLTRLRHSVWWCIAGVFMSAAGAGFCWFVLAMGTSRHPAFIASTLMVSTAAWQHLAMVGIGNHRLAKQLQRVLDSEARLADQVQRTLDKS